MLNQMQQVDIIVEEELNNCVKNQAMRLFRDVYNFQINFSLIQCEGIKK